MNITVTNTGNTSKEGQNSKQITLEPSAQAFALQSMNIWWVQNLRILSYLASESDFMIDSGTEFCSMKLDCIP